MRLFKKARGGAVDDQENSDEKYANSSVDGIKKDVDVKKSALQVERDFRDLEYQEAKSAKRYRFVLFVWGISAASICLAVSMFWMMCSHHSKGDAQIGVAFIASLTVEVIGIIAIIARYLFPEKGMPRSRGSVESISDDDLSSLDPDGDCD